MFSWSKKSFVRRASTAAASLSFALLCGSPATAQTITAVMESGLRVLDPIVTTAYMSRNHGYMIYDTLLATDSDYKVQPQMVDNWQVSDDGKTYTFSLREGLRWHDGAPVTSEDCIASISRWAEQDKMGQMLMTLVASMKATTDKSFEIVLNEPTDLVLKALAKPSGTAPFMMPKRIASTPSTQPIKEHIGSGPFKFVADQFQPGLKVVYEKNEDYQPRAEPASGTAGGKVVHVERVEWVTMPDQMTTVNAFLSNEIDYIQQVPYDLLPMFEGNTDVKIEVLDKLGGQPLYRLNHLHPPFNNKTLRQAAMYAVRAEDVLQALVGNPEYYQVCPSLFGCGTPYESSAGAEMIVSSDLDKAKQLLKEGQYDGTPVVILHPTDALTLAAHPVVIAQALRKAGFNVDLQSMDWQTVVTRRASQQPASEGGWSIFSTTAVVADLLDPVRAFTASANGKQAWFGWPDVPAIEELRNKIARTTDPDELKKLAEEVQGLVIEEGVTIPLGQLYIPTAYHANLTGVLEAPVPLFWNIKKAGK